MPSNGNTNGQVPIQPLAGTSGVPINNSLAGQPGFPASGPLKNAVIPYWSYGSGVPTFVAPVGSLYTNVAVTATGVHILYIYAPEAVGSTTVNRWQVIY